VQAFQQFAVYPTRDQLPVFSDATATRVLRTVNRKTRMSVVRREGAYYIVRILNQVGFVAAAEVSSNRWAEPGLGDGLASGSRGGATGADTAAPNGIVASGFVPADFGSRFFGYLIDYVILMVVGTLIGGGLFVALVPKAEQEDPSDGLVLALYAFAFVLGFLYTWLMDSAGATLGKMAMGIQLVDDATGRAPGLGKGLKRTLVRIVSGIAFCLGFLWALWDSEKKTWHDRASHTSVVRYR
jgi:uncharacterized RDD family membrane protein YckC